MPQGPLGRERLVVLDDETVDCDNKRLSIQWTSPPVIALVGHPLLYRVVVQWITS